MQVSTYSKRTQNISETKIFGETTPHGEESTSTLSFTTGTHSTTYLSAYATRERTRISVTKKNFGPKNQKNKIRKNIARSSNDHVSNHGNLILK